MPERIAPHAELPPSPRRVWARVLTGFLLATWFVFTFFARPMTPVVIRVAEWVEVTAGLDVMRGDELYLRPGEKPPKNPPKEDDR